MKNKYTFVVLLLQKFILTKYMTFYIADAEIIE